MKAMVIRECGPPEVMRLEEISTPTPGPGEVLIRVHAVSVNRTLDLAVRAGTYAVRPTFPHILGVDPSGVVATVGAGVIGRRVGDRVVTRQIVRPATASQGPGILGVHAWGGYAEFVKVHADATHPMPDGLDFVTATVVARHGPTALSMLRDVAKLAADEWVLVMGSVGRITADDLKLTLAWAAEGRYRVLVDQVLPLAEAAHAHRIVEDRSGIGKVLLRP